MTSPGAASSFRVPVLLYHAVTESPGSHVAPFAVSPTVFEQQLDAVLTAGFRCVTFGELMRMEGAGERPGEPIAVITFDDGYRDFATAALPALRSRSLVATLFVTTGWLEGGAPREPGPTDPMLSFSQLPELLEQGVELGAHSHSHPQLDTLGAAALREELSRPKALLEDTLGRAVATFAYPHGYNGPRVRRFTRDAGFESAAAVRNTVHHPDDDRFAVSRLMLTRTTTMAQFRSWLGGVDDVRPSTHETWLTKGWRAYRRSRAIVRRRPGSDYR